MINRPSGIISETLAYITFIDQLAVRLKQRRKIAATATVYFYRVFKKISASDYYLVCCTCLFLASKVEECPANLKTMLIEASCLKIDLVAEISDVIDTESLLLQELEFSLIVFHPYPLLSRYLKDMGQLEILDLAWNVMNDLYKSSVILQYSPHSLALGVIFFLLVFKELEISNSCWSDERFNSVEAASIIQNLLIVYKEMKDYK